MRKWILIIVTLFVWHQFSEAQDLVGCTQLLEDAKEAYAAGMVELVPELLNPCLEAGLTGESRKEAYKLVINAYLFDYMPEMADSLMIDFLKEFPTYRETISDPAEFVLLLQTHRENRPDIQAMLDEEDRIAAEQAAQAQKDALRRELPPGAGEAMGSLGFIVGTSGTFPQIIERYSTGNPVHEEGGFGMASPGFQVGGTFSLPLSRSIEASVDLLFNRTRFNYVNTPFPFTSYEFDEYESHIQLPVSTIFILNPGKRTNVYMRIGIVPDYLLSAAASATRSYTETGTANPGDVLIEKTKITDSRRRLNLYGMGGVGLRMQMPNAYFFLETRYNGGIFMSSMAEHRFDNEDMTWLIYHVDSDFRIHQLNLSAGMAWRLF